MTASSSGLRPIQVDQWSFCQGVPVPGDRRNSTLLRLPQRPGGWTGSGDGGNSAIAVVGADGDGGGGGAGRGDQPRLLPTGSHS